MKFVIDVFKDELTNILNWWETNMVSEKGNGFIGRIDGYNKRYEKADRGGILNARILWSFSAAANHGFNQFERMVRIAYDNLIANFWDEDHGGLFWMIDHQNNCVNSKKQVYAQAFGIYAFSEYYHFTGNEEALAKALNIYDLLEEHALDKTHNGYWEAFTGNWEKMEESKGGVGSWMEKEAGRR